MGESTKVFLEKEILLNEGRILKLRYWDIGILTAPYFRGNHISTTALVNLSLITYYSSLTTGS